MRHVSRASRCEPRRHGSHGLAPDLFHAESPNTTDSKPVLSNCVSRVYNVLHARVGVYVCEFLLRVRCVPCGQAVRAVV